VAAAFDPSPPKVDGDAAEKVDRQRIDDHGRVDNLIDSSAVEKMVHEEPTDSRLAQPLFLSAGSQGGRR
jgi:hypothetical protein